MSTDTGIGSEYNSKNGNSGGGGGGNADCDKNPLKEGTTTRKKRNTNQQKRKKNDKQQQQQRQKQPQQVGRDNNINNNNNNRKNIAKSSLQRNSQNQNQQQQQQQQPYQRQQSRPQPRQHQQQYNGGRKVPVKKGGGGKGLKNGEKGAEAHTVSESYRIGLTKLLLDLRENDLQEDLELPPDLTNTERKFVHQLAGQLGLKSKSKGKGEDRRITVSKIKDSTKKNKKNGGYDDDDDDDAFDDVPMLRVGQTGIHALKNHFQNYPQTHFEKLESRETGASLKEAFNQIDNAKETGSTTTNAAVTETLKELGLGGGTDSNNNNKGTKTGKRVDLQRRKRLHAEAQKLKKQRIENANDDYGSIVQFRSNLPAFSHQEEIVSTIANNAVTIISGETGCGKSTQIPQFLLDANPTASIVVTQPRRVSAISIAERVAHEQGYTSSSSQDNDGGVGGRIGYQVRLESKTSRDTQLVFLTPGILLRRLQSSPTLNEFTHIIIDEIHERDRYTEFLLIALRDLLPQRPDLRLILMSATLQSESLVDYFTSSSPNDLHLQKNTPAEISMEGRTFPVQDFFLETVLEMTGYIDSTTAYDISNTSNNTTGRGGISGVMSETQLEAELAKLTGVDESKDILKSDKCGQENFSDVSKSYDDNNNADNIAVAEELISDDDDDGSDYDIEEDIQGGDISDYYQEHPTYNEESIDCSSSNKIQNITNNSNNTNTSNAPLPTIKPMQKEEREQKKEKWDGMGLFKIEGITGEGGGGDNNSNISQEQENLLNQYQSIHDDKDVDYYLLLEVVYYIVKSSHGDGAILVFLPGWQEISEFMLLLETSDPFCDKSKYLVLPLHSGIPSKDQRKVLRRPPPGTRKIVLSTNIAETSLTIEDVSFVIDAGRAKEKNYDPHLKTSTLQPVWISQASAKQRKGRAGRTKAGVCFHLFSSTRYSSMRQFTESEFLRTPLEEMCLMCKKLELAPGGQEDENGIPSFLSNAMSAPHPKSITNALELLVDLGAMEPETNELTKLGEALSVMSVEPRVGKMVIWSYLLGCASVGCNMAVAMSYKSPFVLPQPTMRKSADASKVQLSRNSQSDQITIHYALEQHSSGRSNTNTNNHYGYNQGGGGFNDFCRKYFLNTNTLRYISDLRKNLSRELKSLGYDAPSVGTETQPQHNNNKYGYYQNRYKNDQAIWQSAIAAGLYPNVACRKRGDSNFSIGRDNRKMKIHVSSVNAIQGQPLASNSKCDIPFGDMQFVCFGEILRGNNFFTAHHTTHLSSPLPLLLLCGTSLSIRPIKNNNDATAADDVNDHNASSSLPRVPMSLLTLDDWIVFKCETSIASHIVTLRKRLDSAFWNAISDPPSWAAAVAATHSTGNATNNIQQQQNRQAISSLVGTATERDAVDIVGTVLKSSYHEAYGNTAAPPLSLNKSKAKAKGAKNNYRNKQKKRY